ncbi:MAG: choice-of-anchor tandem repeat GloVer-containing protein [Terriglobales bacterium]|jgi:uncharacterized repeat protein (TIGR03803 family)
MRFVRALTILMTVMVLAPNSWAGTEKVLHNFLGGSDGSEPADVGRLARDKSGNLYGTTQGGGTCGRGTVFQLSKSHGDWTETVLYSFCGSDGDNPVAGVILDSSDNIYGTTKFGGGCGTVFKLSSSTLTNLYSFTCGNDGGMPDAGVILDKNGNLYGTTQLYGAFGNGNGGGVAYEISGSGAFSVIYTFCSISGCADGNGPDAGLVMDGAIYGTTTRGGENPCGCGTVFKLSQSRNGWVETVLHSFSGRSDDGADPTFASLTPGTQTVGGKKEGVLFGVTAGGGPSGLGTVFMMVKSTSEFTLLHSFAGPDGAAPFGTLAIRKGILFGTTYNGGVSGNGTVFELTQNNDTWTESVVYGFSGGSDGGEPNSGVVADSKGNLYGVTGSGGFGQGVAYQVTP